MNREVKGANGGRNTQQNFWLTLPLGLHVAVLARLHPTALVKDPGLLAEV